MYTKKTLIDWDKNTYQDMVSTSDQEVKNPAYSALEKKMSEMIESGKMDPDGDTKTLEDTVLVTRYFVDQESAKEWVDFNVALADQFGLKVFYARVLDTTWGER